MAMGGSFVDLFNNLPVSASPLTVISTKKKAKQVKAPKNHCKKRDPKNHRVCLDTRSSRLISKRGRKSLSHVLAQGPKLKKSILSNAGSSFYDGGILSPKSGNTQSMGGFSSSSRERLSYDLGLKQETPHVQETRMDVPFPIASQPMVKEDAFKSYFDESLSEMSQMISSASNQAQQSVHQVASYTRGIPTKILNAIHYYAAKYSVDANLVMAMIKQESGGNRYAVSKAGAMGIGQLMPETAKRFGVTNVFDPEQNVMGMVRYLSFLGNRFNGDKVLMVAAYNTGEGHRSYREGLVPHFHETVQYLGKVFNSYFHLTGNKVNFQDRIAPAHSAA